MPGLAVAAALVVTVALAVSACASPPPPHDASPQPRIASSQNPIHADPGAGYPFPSPIALASSIVYFPSPGNPDGTATVPVAAAAEDVSRPDHVVGTGTPASCTVDALAAAVRGGGVTTFNCGPGPIIITLDRTLVTCNTDTCKHPWQGGKPVAKAVIDGGGLVTLSGNDERGIFYANSCEESFGWLSDRCDLQTTPLVVFQNISLKDGNATTGPAGDAGVGGGGGGGAISGLGASIQVFNSLITRNTATGTGASSGQGGNGGGIYGDGNTYSYVVDGTVISGNFADEGGPGIFYVSNDRTGTLTIRNSQIIDNSGENFFTAPYRDIFYLGGGLTVTGSTVQ